MDDPDAYEDGVSELLQEVVARKKKLEELTPEQRGLLNRAVIDFATTSKKSRQQEAAVSPSPPAAIQAAVSPDQDSLPALPGEPDDFWWNR